MRFGFLEGHTCIHTSARVSLVQNHGRVPWMDDISDGGQGPPSRKKLLTWKSRFSPIRNQIVSIGWFLEVLSVLLSLAFLVVCLVWGFDEVIAGHEVGGSEVTRP